MDASITEGRRKAWSAGLIAAWYLRDSQLAVYNFLHQEHRPFVEAARRWGKTTAILCYVLEQLKRNPNWICRWIVPDKLQARTIIKPEIEKIQYACGSDEFIFSTTDSFYEHFNGSKLYLIGADDGKAKSARGAASNILVCDEFGFWRYPEVLSTVLAPQLRTTKGQLIIASTPPEDLGHIYYPLKDQAVREGRFIQKTIWDDESLDDDTLKQIVHDCGGSQSTPSFRREYLCEPVSDPERLVIPEYNEETHDYESNKRPQYFDAYVGADLGFNDNSALLFSHFDFLTQTLYIEDELVVCGKNSREIAEAAKTKEAALWGQVVPYLRVSDNEIQQLHDFATLCGYPMVPTRKDDKLAAINALRLCFSRCKIKIHKRCKSLRFQLKVGLWNEQKTNYLRGDATGHLDAIDALVYLYRNLNKTHNPWPLRDPSIQHNTHFIPEDLPKYDDEMKTLRENLLGFGKIS